VRVVRDPRPDNFGGRVEERSLVPLGARLACRSRRCLDPRPGLRIWLRARLRSLISAFGRRLPLACGDYRL
jgi:hypothetical protein